MAKDSKESKSASKPTDQQGKDEDPFYYAARRKTELSNNAEHSTHRAAVNDEGVPYVIEERGPVGG